jgi:hypothetical protein
VKSAARQIVTMDFHAFQPSLRFGQGGSQRKIAFVAFYYKVFIDFRANRRLYSIFEG